MYMYMCIHVFTSVCIILFIYTHIYTYHTHLKRSIEKDKVYIQKPFKVKAQGLRVWVWGVGRAVEVTGIWLRGMVDTSCTYTQ